jgi:inorganic phosphate transporter, PiT family
MADGSVLPIPAIAVTPAAEFVNGWTDAPDAIATVLSNLVPSPSQAVRMAAYLDRTVVSVPLRIP